MKHHPLRVLALMLAMGTFAGPASAHDTWFVPVAADGGRTRLELTTGNRFPVGEFAVAPSALVDGGCIGRDARDAPLRAGDVTATALRVSAGTPALACWMEMSAYDVEIESDVVKLYFDEIRPPAAVREAWAALQARGIGWKERYRKYARVELASAARATATERAVARRPRGQGLEIVIVGEGPVTVGAPLEFQLLRDGQPLPGLMVELVSDRGAIGIWRETDARGNLRHTLPFAGRWLLRATELRLVPGEDRWESRFVTLAVEAPARP